MQISRHTLHRGDYIGFAAFGGVVLGSFSSFVFRERIGGEPWQLVLTFVLGTLFLVLGIASHRIVDETNFRQAFGYFIIQAGLSLGCIWVSPVQGFFGILCLPLASQCVFLFRWKFALLCTFALYVSTAMVYFPPYGWHGFFEAMLAYSPGYLFTVGFSFVTVDAVRGRITAAALTEDLETANSQLRAHAEQAEELATTRERNRLAREIHDGVGHYLTVINIQLEAARALFDKDPVKAQTAVDTAARLSKEALDDVRRSVGTLRTEGPRPGLSETLQHLVNDAGLSVDFAIEGEYRRLSSSVEHALYRATQEGLTNVRKHAGADRARVRLDFRHPSVVILSVVDDGRGSPDNTTVDGYGLKGMHERIKLLGGKVSTHSRPEGGFHLQVEVPV
jgi:signal transduction histidine kinase